MLKFKVWKIKRANFLKINNNIVDSLKPVKIFKEEILKNIEFTGISQDSRKISKGNIFVCIEGENFDGHKFVAQAVKNGADLVVCQKDLPEEINCPCILVEDTKFAIARLSAFFYNYPSKELDLIGVTGTNGKTTVTHLIETIFEQTGSPCALIGTLGSRFSSEEDYASTDHTTPQATELQQNLRTFADKGVKKVVMEVSSHSLEQHRVADCEFSGAVFTNLTQDHLDYHVTMENYFKAKTKLLNLLKKHSDSNKYAVINADDKYFARLPGIISEEAQNIKILTYGIKNNADIIAENIEFSPTGAKFLCKTPFGEQEANIQLAGMFNIYNVLAALSVGLAEGIDLKSCLSAVESVPCIAGRFETVSRKPLVIVDYAHTPNGLENILQAAKLLVPDNGSLICVFGCGGDRDVTKRPQMGKIAEDFCDKVIITSDNPRTEDQQQIITDILTGIQELNSQKVIVEIDRTIAIEQAILSSNPQDVIVIAGKGHETYQIIGDQKIHFDDREEAQNALKKLNK